MLPSMSTRAALVAGPLTLLTALASAALLLAALASAAFAPAALGRPAPAASEAETAAVASGPSSHLWATVNICDTHRHPRMVGIRGQMPGLKFRTSMSMEIEAQFFSTSQGRFEPDPYAMRLVSLGQAKGGLHQGGVIFQFHPQVLLSGVITFRWRRNGKLVKTAIRKTGRGYKHVDYSDPPGYSRAVCKIK